MERSKKSIILLRIIFSGILLSYQAYSQNKPLVGAYYFDGWTGKYPYHITESLKDSFPDRKPKWGWVTSTQEIIDEQIKLAADSGISFFSFCWYYGAGNFKTEALNQALRFYLVSPQKKRLKYCLLIANHVGNEIGPTEWDQVSAEWIEKFKVDTYLKVDGKPLLIFFSINSLIKKFGTIGNVHSALDNLRSAALKAGLAGVSIAVCIGPNKENIQQAESCGFDVLTGYNYHDVGIYKALNREVPIDTMRVAEQRYWNRFPKLSSLKYIPVSTLNWDPRPWANNSNGYASAPYFVGYSPNSVYKSVKGCIDWVNANPQFTTKEKIALLYAWNENGEGAWLTPGINGVNMLDGLKKAMNK